MDFTLYKINYFYYIGEMCVLAEQNLEVHVNSNNFSHVDKT